MEGMGSRGRGRVWEDDGGGARGGEGKDCLLFYGMMQLLDILIDDFFFV